MPRFFNIPRSASADGERTVRPEEAVPPGEWADRHFYRRARQDQVKVQASSALFGASSMLGLAIAWTSAPIPAFLGAAFFGLSALWFLDIARTSSHTLLATVRRERENATTAEIQMMSAVCENAALYRNIELVYARREDEGDDDLPPSDRVIFMRRPN